MQFQLVFPILSIKFSWEVFSSGWITRTILAAFLILVILNNGCAVKTPDIDQSLRAKALEGNAQSQYEVGEQYSDAWYSSFSLFDNNQDLREEAAVWYEMAANQGHAEAQYKLSLFYFQKDREKSFYWTKRAAMQGLSEAQSSLGWHYGQAWGTPQDLVQAYKWLALSYRGEGGLQELFRQCDRPINMFNPKWIIDIKKMSTAQSGLELLIHKGQMSPEQIAEGRRLALENEPKYGKARSIKLNQ